MSSDTQIVPPSKKMFWAGWIISALPILLMGVMGLIILLVKPSIAEEGTVKSGYPLQVVRPILIVEIACVLLYAIPRTSVLGAILLTGYLGGAVATHVRIGEPFFFPIIVGVLVWLGLFLRDARLRALIPLRS